MGGRCAPPTSHRLQRVICRPATRKRSPPPRSKHPPGCGQRSSRSPTQRWAISMDKVALLPATDRAALFGETGAGRGVVDTIIEKDFWRSEEHTSELQSLMRISYAVFCLKNKTRTT